MKILVALILLACIIAPSEVDLYFKKKALKKAKEEYALWEKYQEGIRNEY